MERLTTRDGVWRERIDSDKINHLYKQLAAYENTGFTPEDFDELCRFMSETRKALGIKTFDELRKAVEDGVIIRLPCKVGDTVYKLWYEPCHLGNTYPDSFDCDGCEDACDLMRTVVECKAPSVEWIIRNMTSKRPFAYATREEAEAALVRFADGNALSEVEEKNREG